MIWLQKEILLSPKPRGFHLVTDEIINYLPEIKNIKTGLLSILLQHTSASITLNENFDPGVRADLEKYFNKNVRENEPYYEHNSEGADDMPAHIKSVLIGNSITIPLTDGKLNLGAWQGIFLCEHRNAAGARKIVATIAGI